MPITRNQVDTAILALKNKTVAGSFTNTEDADNRTLIMNYIDQEVAKVQPYLKYVAIITQSSTNNPVAIVLENNTGATIAWTRTGMGVYEGTASVSGLFTNQKTWLSIAPISYGVAQEIWATSESIVRIRTADASSFALADGQLNETSVEIRIYP